MAETRLGPFIKAHREDRDLTQEELARKIHTKRSTIEAIENGRVKQPSVPLLNALAEALGIPGREMARALGLNVDNDAQAFESANQSVVDDLLRLIPGWRSRFPTEGDGR